jgi:hypothetical protein
LLDLFYKIVNFIKKTLECKHEDFIYRKKGENNLRTFIDAVNQIKRELNIVDDTTNQASNWAKFTVRILDENVSILVLKTSVTGTERPKPQIRVFTDKILQEVNDALNNNERFFCFVHCSHDETTLKFNQITPSDYIVSLESDWNSAGGRIDIRSVYDFLEEHPETHFKKLNKTEHSTKSILQAAIFKYTDNGFENFEPYISFFDSRLITRDETVLDDVDVDIDVDIDEEMDQATLVNTGINKIYFGAPGTGKSFSIQKFIRENGIPHFEEKKGHPNVFRTTLHPEFTYYDFVGQVMPVVTPIVEGSSETKIEYGFVPTIFTKALKRAFSEGVKDRQPVFLILEEMSRANVAAVFGDLFQLLDRDVVTGESEYRINNDLISNYVFNEDKQIYIPKNLFIIGTVNTNDQNVFVMDTAFKRRFEFEYVNANAIVLDESGQPRNNFSFTLKDNDNDITLKWSTLYRSLNTFITKKVENGGLGLKEDKQLGQFFIKYREDDQAYNFNQVKGKLLQYLYEDIESVSYTNTSLFKPDISSFGEAYLKMSKKENIFSNEFINNYRTLETHDLREGK